MVCKVVVYGSSVGYAGVYCVVVRRVLCDVHTHVVCVYSAYVDRMGSMYSRGE